MGAGFRRVTYLLPKIKKTMNNNLKYIGPGGYFDILDTRPESLARAIWTFLNFAGHRAKGTSGTSDMLPVYSGRIRWDTETPRSGTLVHAIIGKRHVSIQIGGEYNERAAAAGASYTLISSFPEFMKWYENLDKKKRPPPI
jgi:hypothetical protein